MKNKGFTLIEILVVVLIIGILAAIAVPQYRFFVIKSRTSNMFPIVKSILEAEEIYYLANRSYTGSIEDLDVIIPSECWHIYYNEYDDSNLQLGEMFACGKFFLLDNSARDNRVSLNYCPNNNTSWNNCAPRRDFQISFRGRYSTTGTPNSRKCSVLNNSSLGKRICTLYGELDN